MKGILVSAIFTLGNGLLSILQLILYSKPRNPKSILIFRTGSIGDSLCAFPAIYQIRNHFAEAKIDILTASGDKNLVSIDKMLDPKVFDEIIDYQGLSVREWTRIVKSNKYDLIIQLPQSKAPLKSLVRDLIFFRLVTKIKSGIGWHWASIPLFKRYQEKNCRFVNERRRLVEILEKQNIPRSSDRVEIRANKKDHDKVYSLLTELNISKEKESIAVVVGAKRLQNRWPIEKFKAVCESLQQTYNVFLIGGPEDVDISKPLNELTNVFNFTGKCTPVQSALLFEQCVLTISNDTGPMHLSYFSGTPVVALFSSRDFPNLWYPPNDGINVALRANDVPCSLCLSETCANNICMQSITVVDVLNSVQDVLQNKHKA